MKTRLNKRFAIGILPIATSFTALPQETVSEVTTNAFTEINDDATENKNEEHINGLIADFAWILLLGAIVTILFKKLKQPIVLGYILAGFLASPKFTLLPSISNLDNISFWADLGIIVLMFTLGLEFSFKKLMNAGSSAIITALIIITGMTFSGFGVGHLLNLSTINCIFLGGMISMSSTTIILKTLTDLGLKQKKFASLVLAVLIIEDLFAVLMLVLLSSLAMGNVEGAELLMSIGKLVFFLVLWFVVGVYVLPTLLAKMHNTLNSETMLILAMALCFSMAIFSVTCGFSLELGAFVMGSILAGTMFAERMEKVVEPIKNLFGAVFFISVGMMVDPGIIAAYWWEILMLAAVVIVGMIIFGAAGMLITGQSLKVAVESGFTLTQIGEFSYIIAALGMSLGVLEASLYPIIVAVSVITIFTTPYFVKLSQPAYRGILKILPEKMHTLISGYSLQTSDSNETRTLWRDILSRYLWRILTYSVVLLAIILLSRQMLFPLLQNYSLEWGKLIATLVTLAAMSPFLVALSFSSTKPSERMELHRTASVYDVPMVAMRVIRHLISLLFIVWFLSLAYGSFTGWVCGLIFFAIIIAISSRDIMKGYKRMEDKFINNLNIRENTRLGLNNSLVSDLHQAYMPVSDNSPFVGDRLRDAGLRRDYGVSVSSIQRGDMMMPLPDGDTRIFPGDVLGIIGTDDQIKSLSDDLICWENAIKEHPKQPEVELKHIKLKPNSPIIGIPLSKTDIRRDFYSMIVKVQMKGGEFDNPSPDTVLKAGDTIWVVGDPAQMKKMSGTSDEKTF